MLCMALSALRLLHFAVYGLLSFFMGISVRFISHMVWPSYQAIFSIIYSPDDLNSAPTGCCINDWLYLVLHYSNRANTLAFSFVVFIIVLSRLLMRIASLFTESIAELTKCVNRKNNWKVRKCRRSL